MKPRKEIHNMTRAELLKAIGIDRQTAEFCSFEALALVLLDKEAKR